MGIGQRSKRLFQCFMDAMKLRLKGGPEVYLGKPSGMGTVVGRLRTLQAKMWRLFSREQVHGIMGKEWL